MKQATPMKKLVDDNINNLSEMMEMSSIKEVKLDVIAKYSQAILMNPPWASESTQGRGITMEAFVSNKFNF